MSAIVVITEKAIETWPRLRNPMPRVWGNLFAPENRMRTLRTVLILVLMVAATAAIAQSLSGSAVDATTGKPIVASATDGSELGKSAALWMKGALEGTMGTALGLAGTAIGLWAGVLQQSMKGLAVGVGLTLSALYGPSVIASVSGAMLVFGA